MFVLGSISGKYESNNDAGRISTGRGDLGGISYGSHQFIASVANNFARWLQEKGSPYGTMLAQHKAPSTSFSDTWRHVARMDYEGFLNLQHEYTQEKYYNEAAIRLKGAGYDVDKHSIAVKEMVFSRSVQYGSRWITDLFKKGMQFIHPEYPNLSYVNEKHFDSMLISGVYDFLVSECDNAYQLANGSWHSPDDWANGSYDVVKHGLHDRFINEKADLLNLLAEEN